ncbi:hypothetical protein GOPIP_039_01380 [Gordonia polyisoprenivorans NBRC 16320 = JCM 10675]|nr:hypothetical protein GOPIP_039_01380 [Gordonia polyisoprenivorans NBRC 16320 = JCM 10675]
MCATETPSLLATTGSSGTSSGSDGVGGWFSEHAGTVMFAIVAVVNSSTPSPGSNPHRSHPSTLSAVNRNALWAIPSTSCTGVIQIP